MNAIFGQVSILADRSYNENPTAVLPALMSFIFSFLPPFILHFLSPISSPPPHLFEGCFEYMKDKFSHSPTLDMSEEMLALFSDLMRVIRSCSLRR